MAIKTINNCKDNLQVKSSTLNGEKIKESIILHSQITEGGELLLQMDSTDK